MPRGNDLAAPERIGLMDTAVVTGGSRGIGRSVAATFVERGAHVVVCARDAEELERAVADIDSSGEAVTAVRADVRDEFDVERLVETAARAGDVTGIDCVVANAGVFYGTPGETPIEAVPYSAFDDTLRTNVRGVFTTVRESIPHLTADARVLVPSGRIAREATGGYGAYAVSKAAAEAVIRQFAAETTWPMGIVDLGTVKTELTDRANGRDPGDVAPMFWWAAVEADPETVDGEVLGLREWKRATG